MSRPGGEVCVREGGDSPSADSHTTAHQLLGMMEQKGLKLQKSPRIGSLLRSPPTPTVSDAKFLARGHAESLRPDPEPGNRVG